jgi:hypothetical protein
MSHAANPFMHASTSEVGPACRWRWIPESIRVKIDAPTRPVAPGAR